MRSVLLFFCVALTTQPTTAPAPRVVPVSDELRKTWNLSPFYKKHLDLNGLPVLASEKVSDEAVIEAGDVIDHMIADRDDIRAALIERKVRYVVMAPTEMTTDIPEHSDLTPKDYWDRRARGLGATRARPAVSCGEENLLNLKGDRYPKENILIHEFSHAIHEMALRSIDPTFDANLRRCYDDAMARGLWKNTYAATNHSEYWAEAVQSYFDCNNPPDRQHNDANTRERLAEYDPALFKLIDKTFNHTKWRYVRYDRRHATPSTQP